MLPKIYLVGFVFQEMDCDLNDMPDDTTKEQLEETIKTRDEKARISENQRICSLRFFLGIAIWQRFQ